jgi:hypothetical protein
LKSIGLDAQEMLRVERSRGRSIMIVVDFRGPREQCETKVPLGPLLQVVLLIYDSMRNA